LANEEHRDRFAQDERSSLEGYQAYDMHYEKIGTVDDLFVDDDDRPKYVGVKTGLLGTRTTLIPIELMRVNDKRKLPRRRRRSEGTGVKRRIVFEF
jgi:PRC-barrel domain